MTDYSEKLSDRFLQRVVLNKRPLYQIGDDVGLSAPDMSRLLRGQLGRWSEKNWRSIIERVGLSVGLKSKECWK